MNDGDMLELTHTLASKVGVHGLFSDWPATTTFYANCMMKSLSPEGSSCDPLAPNSPPRRLCARHHVQGGAGPPSACPTQPLLCVHGRSQLQGLTQVRLYVSTPNRAAGEDTV